MFNKYVFANILSIIKITQSVPLVNLGVLKINIP